MSWRDELRPASFRGVPFEMIDLSGEEGRRFVADETPETDALAPTNDLGRIRPRFRVRAFVVGDDYLDRRDRLLAALNAFGPGELVHPWRGRIRVQVGAVSWAHGPGHGACTVEWDCVLAGGEPLTVVTPIPASQITDQAALASAAALEMYEDAADAGDPLMPDFDGTVVVPELELIESMVGVDAVGRALADTLDDVDDWRRLLAYVQSAVAYAWRSLGTPSGEATAAAVSDAQDAIRLQCLVRVAVLASEATYTSADQAEEAMSEVADEIGGWLGDIDDRELFVALTDLRTALVDTLTASANRLPRKRTINIPVPRPAIVIAFDLYGARRLAAREAEIVELNAIGHPGLVVGDIEVLSR